MLRIPTAGDVPPPLLIPLRKIAAVEREENGRMFPRGSHLNDPGNHSWEKQPKASDTVKNGPSQMRLMLIVGAILLVLVVAGGGILMTMGPKTQGVSKNGATPASNVKTLDPKATPEASIRGDFSYLAEIEPLARKFLNATTAEEILPIIRHPAVTEARIREFYPDGKIEPVGMSQFSAATRLIKRGKFLVVMIVTRAQEVKPLLFIETPQGLKVDWENWIGWSSISWEKFLTDKPVTDQVFRVTLAPVEYYNFGFSDETKWQSYRIESTDRKHVVYGYVERSSMLNKRIRPAQGVSNVNVMLSLKFPEESTSNNQILIGGFVGEGWVEEAESP